MQRILLLLVLSSHIASLYGQQTELEYRVRKKTTRKVVYDRAWGADMEGRQLTGDTAAYLDPPPPLPDAAAIYWYQPAPLYHGYTASQQAYTLAQWAAQPIAYRDSCCSADSSLHSYRAIDLVVRYMGENFHYHSNSQRLTDDMRQALRRLKKGSVATFQLHRITSTGTPRTDQLTYSIYHVRGMAWKHFLIMLSPGSKAHRTDADRSSNPRGVTKQDIPR